MAALVAGDAILSWIGADKIDQAQADALAVAASDSVQSYIERDLSMVTIARDDYDTTGVDFILLRRWPVQSIGGVAYQGKAVVPMVAGAATGWRMDYINRRKLQLVGYGNLGNQIMAVSVTNMIAGYDPNADVGSATGIPGHIAAAINLTATALFTAQASDPNLASESISGVFSGYFYPTGAGAVPPGARSLLQREMRSAP